VLFVRERPTETTHPPIGDAQAGAAPDLVSPTDTLNRRELDRYVGRVSGRWPLDRALLGGARVADLRGAGPQRERVYQAGSLWDASEMGDRADVHCYTPPELERRVQRLPIVREAVSDGIDLLASS
jgi:hypothetical protein